MIFQVLPPCFVGIVRYSYTVIVIQLSGNNHEQKIAGTKEIKNNNNNKARNIYDKVTKGGR